MASHLSTSSYRSCPPMLRHELHSCATPPAEATTAGLLLKRIDVLLSTVFHIDSHILGSPLQRHLP